jgi:peptidoglycan/LPS O-acetylase OafA/YrhL
MAQNSRYEVLDGMRGLAAILVMLFHYNIQHGYRIFYNVFTAVDFFFILSGFVILHSYGKKLQNQITSREFVIRRIARLLPMAALGVLMGMPALLAMAYLGQSNYSPFEIIAVTLGNMLFIPALNSNWFILDGAQISGQIFPTNGPMWSIFFELAISFAFIFLYRLRNSTIAKISVTSFILIAAFSVWNGHVVGNRMFDFDAGWNSSNFLGGIPRVVFGFTCGMFIYRMTTATIKSSLFQKLDAIPPLSPVVVYSLLLIVLMFPFYIKGLYSLVEIGVLAPLLVLFGSRSNTSSPVMKKLSEQLGLMSFPIYCFHYPILTSLKSLAAKTELCDPQSIALMFAAIIVTVITSYAMLELFQHIKIQHNLIHFLESCSSSRKVKTTA